MRVLGILLVFSLFPFFMWLLYSRQARNWAIVALGALPILDTPLNLDAALLSWPAWPGHTKGLLLTAIDPLALAICFHLKSPKRVPALSWAFLAYFASLIPGLFSGELFQPAFFFVFQFCRVGLFSYATCLVVQNGYLRSFAQGLAIAVILNALVSLRSALGGAGQVPGMLGHQNLTGMAVNICVPLLVALALRKRGSFFFIAVGAAGLSAIVGGSRATIVFYGVAVATTMLGSAMLKPTSRKMVAVAAGLVALLAVSPFAFSKVEERGGVSKIDLERVAFERAANMMISDHPGGVGINQYVVIANSGGYLDRAGVRWGAGARSTNVHNFYLLARVEGGLVELGGVLIWLFTPLLVALVLAFRRKAPLRDVSFAAATAIAITALHNRYEWIFVTTVPQYLIGSMMAVVAAIQTMSKAANSTSAFANRSRGKLQATQLATVGAESAPD